MADIDEIRLYLESHPEDHKQRWRLAKKLYKAWDYRSALAELEILKGVWPDQVPVVRYLAATYFRLGKYDDAAAALLPVITRNPEDDSLLEQLAKIHEGSGELAKAMDIWTRISAIKPGAKATEALERLGMALGGTVSSTLQSASMHSGDTLKTCPHCGEGNDIYSRHCARCHGELTSQTAQDLPQEAPAPAMRGVGLIIMLSLLVVSAVAAGVFIALK